MASTGMRKKLITGGKKIMRDHIWDGKRPKVLRVEALGPRITQKGFGVMAIAARNMNIGLPHPARGDAR